jgi:hypothetical protein
VKSSTHYSVIESVKEILHGLYSDWFVATGGTDWSAFIKAHYEPCRQLLRALNDVPGTSTSGLLSRASTEEGVFSVFLQYNLIEGATKACQSRVKLVALTRENERKLALETATMGNFFLSQETQFDMAKAVDANVKVLLSRLQALTITFDKLAIDEAEIEETLESLYEATSQPGEGNPEHPDIIEINMFEGRLSYINTRRVRLLNQQLLLAEQLEKLIGSFTSLHDLCVRFNVESFDFANQLTDQPTAYGRTGDHLNQQMGVPADVRAKQTNVNAVVRAIDADILHKDQTAVIEGLGARVQALAQALDVEQKEEFAYTEVEFEPLEDE